LTGDQPLDQADHDLFYKLMGGNKALSEEGKAVVDHFSRAFLNNDEFYRFVCWMSGDGDLYFTFRVNHGYPLDILATHATIPINENGDLVPFLGKTGRDSLVSQKYRIQLGLEAWRQLVEDGDPSMLELHRNWIDELALLPWDRSSPVYARQMQTAARAVLAESTGTWKEPKEPFYSHFEKGEDREMLERARRNIAASFGFSRPDRFVIVNGHEPTKDGMFALKAGGTVIRIDAGMAQKYGGLGGALVFGTEGAAWLSYPKLEYTRVPLPGV
jgi:fructose-1,6-bisphosphatase